MLDPVNPHDTPIVQDNLEQIICGALMSPGLVNDPRKEDRPKRLEMLKKSGISREHFRDDFNADLFNFLLQIIDREGNPPTPEQVSVYMAQANTVNDVANIEASLTGMQGTADLTLRKVSLASLCELLVSRRPAPRDWGVDQFPYWVFPPKIRDFLASVADCAQVSYVLPGVTALGIISALTCRSGWKCKVKEGLVESSNLYVMVAADPSEHKSTVMKPLMSKIKAIEAEMLATWANERTLIEGAIASLEAQKKAHGVTPSRVAELAIEIANKKIEMKQYPSLKVDDCTVEALARILQKNDCVVFASAEGQVIGNMMNPYGDSKQLHSIWMKAWSGDEAKIDRKGEQEPIVIDSPYVAIALLIQPKMLDTIASEVKDSRELGLISRVMAAFPTSLVGSRGAGGGIHFQAEWDAMIGSTYSTHGEVLRLSEEAWTKIEAWRAMLEKEIAPGSKLEYIKDWVGKLQFGQVARMATVLHVVWDMPGTEISGAIMDRALDLGRFFLSHTERVFEAYAGDDAEEGLINKVIAAVDKPRLKGGFYFKDVEKNKSLKGENLNEVLNALVTHGVIEKVLDGAGNATKKMKLTGKKMPTRESRMPVNVKAIPPREDEEIFKIKLIAAPEVTGVQIQPAAIAAIAAKGDEFAF